MSKIQYAGDQTEYSIGQLQTKTTSTLHRKLISDRFMNVHKLRMKHEIRGNSETRGNPCMEWENECQ
jgi:hypothetical protein